MPFKALGSKTPLQIEVVWSKRAGQKEPHVEGSLGANLRSMNLRQMWSCLHVFVHVVFSARSILWSFGAGVGRGDYWALSPEPSLPT